MEHTQNIEKAEVAQGISEKELLRQYLFILSCAALNGALEDGHRPASEEERQKCLDINRGTNPEISFPENPPVIEAICKCHDALMNHITGPSVESLESASRRLATRMNDYFDHAAGAKVEEKDLENIIFCVLKAELRGEK